MKKIFLLLMSFSFLNAFAFSLKPVSPDEVLEKCPDVHLLKAANLSTLQQFASQYSVFAEESYYNTDYLWNFGIYGFEANNEKEAMIEGQRILKTIFGIPAPHYDPFNHAWECIYRSKSHAYVRASVKVEEPTPE